VPETQYREILQIFGLQFTISIQFRHISSVQTRTILLLWKERKRSQPTDGKRSFQDTEERHGVSNEGFSYDRNAGDELRLFHAGQNIHAIVSRIAPRRMRRSKRSRFPRLAPNAVSVSVRQFQPMEPKRRQHGRISENGVWKLLFPE
jgi:hypothetical protein